MIYVLIVTALVGLYGLTKIEIRAPMCVCDKPECGGGCEKP